MSTRWPNEEATPRGVNLWIRNCTVTLSPQEVDRTSVKLPIRLRMAYNTVRPVAANNKPRFEELSILKSNLHIILLYSKIDDFSSPFYVNSPLRQNMFECGLHIGLR